MTKRLTLMVLVIGIAIIAIGPCARADTLETLVMPGPVTNAHQKVENECAKCHSPFSKGVQNSLCVACHDKVGADIKVKSGFHGREPSVAAKECKACHTDHKGRDFDIVGLNKEAFDHSLTDFKLTGAHGKTACGYCHPASRKFRDAASDCFTCHQKDDSHHGSMGKDCAGCHTAETWRGTAFDHGKTKFPLIGAHAKARCSACHPSERYKNTPTACASCHGLEDVHHGVYGDNCQSCHTATEWKKAIFDHAKTKFPLLGRHKALSCATCHTPAMTTVKLATQCIDCHKADDVHKGGNGAACKDCHGDTSWKRVKFDHNKDTKFALLGGHKDVACNACHKLDAQKVKLQTTCVSCHLGDDPHKQQLGAACQNCHDDASWGGKVRFNHDIGAFPLLGLHAAAPCEACHLTAAFKDSKTDCLSCHEKDDAHKGGMGKACASCHNPNGWAFWQFDHATQTDFPLKDAHEGLVCKACHQDGGQKSLKIASVCISCHAADDTHAGRFGTRCDQCHGTDKFKNVRIRR